VKISQYLERIWEKYNSLLFEPNLNMRRAYIYLSDTIHWHRPKIIWAALNLWTMLMMLIMMMTTIRFLSLHVYVADLGLLSVWSLFYVTHVLWLNGTSYRKNHPKEQIGLSNRCYYVPLSQCPSVRGCSSQPSLCCYANASLWNIR